MSAGLGTALFSPRRAGGGGWRGLETCAKTTTPITRSQKRSGKEIDQIDG